MALKVFVVKNRPRPLDSRRSETEGAASIYHGPQSLGSAATSTPTRPFSAVHLSSAHVRVHAGRKARVFHQRRNAVEWGMAQVIRIELQERDIAFLRGLFECRVMTIEHASSLYFDGHGEYAKKRLQKLKSARVIAERPRKQFEPSVLFLLHAGLIALRERGILSSYPDITIPTLARRAQVSEITLAHELAVLDLKVAFHLAAGASHNLSLVEFCTWPALNEFVAAGRIVKPDAFVRLDELLGDGRVRKHAFYVELDRSTETLDILVTRARSYVAHRKFASKERTDVSQAAFRVLYVLQSDERRKNIARRLLTSTPPVLSLVSLATTTDAKRDPFGAIWTRPLQYKRSTEDSLSHENLLESAFANKWR